MLTKSKNGGGYLTNPTNKKGFTLIELLAVIVILAVIALIATPLLMNVINDSKKGTYYRSIENIERGAELYITNSDQEYKINEEIIIPVSALEDYVKNLTEEQKKHNVIARVTTNDILVYYDGRDYNEYTNNKKLKELIESDTAHIKKNVKVNGEIVNKVIGTKAEKDSVMKNYVWYSGNLWQVLETSDKTIKMVLAHSITSIPYGSTNDWNTSWIRAWLNELSEEDKYDGIFYNGLSRGDILEEGNFCLDEPNVTSSELKFQDGKAYIVTRPTIYNPISSCTTKSKDKVGLLTFEDYAYANTGNTAVFTGGSFLDEDEFMWTMSKYTKTSQNNLMWVQWYTNIDGKSGNLVVDTGGTIDGVTKNSTFSRTNNYGHGVRPVVYISNENEVLKGTGTKKDPYILSVKDTTGEKQVLTNATIGEYIYLDEVNGLQSGTETVVNGLTYTFNKNKVRYRIIDILDDGSIKVQRADVLRNLPNTTAVNSGMYVPFYYKNDTTNINNSCGYISGIWYTEGCKTNNFFKPKQGIGDYKYTDSENIGYFLNGATNSYYNWFSDETKTYILNTNWELPVTSHASDYRIRLNRENDVTNKTNYWENNFDGVEEAKIGLLNYGERYSGNDLNISYWFINRWQSSSSDVGYVRGAGHSDGACAGYSWYGVRPVMRLDSNILITSGNGTSSSPYTIKK